MPEEHKQWGREVPNRDPVCMDKHASCKEWADAGECKRNEGFMLDTCPYSCPDGCPHPLDPPGPKATALVRAVRAADAEWCLAERGGRERSRDGGAVGRWAQLGGGRSWDSRFTGAPSRAEALATATYLPATAVDAACLLYLPAVPACLLACVPACPPTRLTTCDCSCLLLFAVPPARRSVTSGWRRTWGCSRRASRRPRWSRTRRASSPSSGWGGAWGGVGLGWGACPLRIDFADLGARCGMSCCRRCSCCWSLDTQCGRSSRLHTTHAACRWLEPAEADKLAAAGALDFGPRAFANSLRAAASALKLGVAPALEGDEGQEGAAKQAGAGSGRGKGSTQQFVRAKELETEVQRLHNELKKRDREVRRGVGCVCVLGCSAQRRGAGWLGGALAAVTWTPRGLISNSPAPGPCRCSVECRLWATIKWLAARLPLLQLAKLKKEADEVLCTREGAAASGGAAEERRSALAAGGRGVVVQAGSGVWLAATESKISLALNVAMAVILVLVVLQPRRRMGKSSREVQ